MRIPDIFRREFQSAKLGWASASSKVQVLRRARSSSMRTNAPPASVGSKTRHQVTEKYQDYFLDVLAVDSELAKQLGIAKRKAYYYVEIDRAFSELKVDNRRLNRIGWTGRRQAQPSVT